MPDDARISTALPRHPKTVKLHRRHGAEGCWSLVCLFLWVSENRPEGDLAGMTAEDVEIAAGWTGDAGEFVRALSEVRFLDGADGTFSVHDWSQHNPWAATRKQRVEAARANALKRWGKMPSACEPHASGINPQCSPPTHHLLTTAPKNICAELNSAPAIFTLLCVGKGPKEFHVTEAHLTEWSTAFPDVDVLQELQRARAWLQANPTKRKTHKGMPRFLVGWLGRQQDSSKASPKGKCNADGFDEWFKGTASFSDAANEAQVSEQSSRTSKL